MMTTDLIFLATMLGLFLLTLRRRYDCRRDDQPVDDLLAAIRDLRSTLIAAHAANNGLAAELAADKAALVAAQARIAALTAQLDAAPVA